MYHIVLFDGECNLCDKSVRFITARDPDMHFRFASLQGRRGKEYIKQFAIDEDADSVVLIRPDGTVLYKSDAALTIASKLKSPFRAAAVLTFLPRSIRDRCYDLIAGSRFKWFGRKEFKLPENVDKRRFLD
ncbi:thiol-disulfide oxidoreductase DCC family protein [Alkalicoccus chagannorensis]|uniref:thiol-disulfide oxidoreductase DCC family protein n=1 Tax=Alkalicoccus chagannorensis TaxID=427072 RepID=UPI0004166B9F|nr:DCC1-like thiol-disulfide oxidoreductase family protein [Alkalicoccus chagannorensis]